MIDVELGMGKSTNSSVCYVSGQHSLLLPLQQRIISF